MGKKGFSHSYPLKLLDKLFLSIQWKKGTTRLGLDGKFTGKGKGVHNFTDLGGKKVIGVFLMKGQKEIEQVLLTIEEKERKNMREVFTDLDLYYISLGKICFPNTHIVENYYHVIALTTKKLEEFRKIFQ